MANLKNLAYGLVHTAPTPADSGTTLIVEPGQGARFPPTPFVATVWPITVMPDPTNAEIIRVTTVAGDTLTITRAQESTTARTILAGDQIAAALTQAFFAAVPFKTDPTVVFDGVVTATGGLASGATLTAAGATTLSGALAVSGHATVTGGATVSGGSPALDITGTVAIAGNLACHDLTCTTIQPGATLYSATLQGYRETLQELTYTAGGALVVDYPLGNHVAVTLAGNITGITITNLPGAGVIAPLMLYYKSNPSGSLFSVAHTINGVAVRFPNASAPVLASTANKIDRILYTTLDGGTTWLGDVIGLNH